MDANDVVLEVEHLTKHYPIKKGLFGKSDTCVHAVEDVSFEVHRGETFAIVGESGCGKSTTGKCILRLTEPTSGTVMLDGKDFTSLKGDDLVEARKKLKLIFQDPYSSLNPRMTVADIIAEPIDIAKTYATRAERDARVDQIMQAVGLDLSYRARYPHEFSGGQRQRIGIARAIVLEPEVVICDEPVSALDVSVQAKVINLLEKLQDDMGISFIFISHDLSVVKHIADNVMVMYLGHMMERASDEELFSNPAHPYTQALLDVIPRIRRERIRDKTILQGDVPSPTNPPSGCCFHTRCTKCMRVCGERVPEAHEIAPGHLCACHLYDESLTDEERTPAVEVPLDAEIPQA
ncbi:MAG: dipeptide ABC transporter ATP-binding protein [Atopobiaceae bacterium]|nr:dipeptide ABC transporter ATP-binding protein [Atopobiaceae bacterium]MCI2173440.1 dipeptide ABC transporter ATP-binding protein [Atopobiaceae bacterium]MCI2207435.1 dipeptide ABC transporter ATP-binding protein [Atopobiaceae bacterium]